MRQKSLYAKALLIASVCLGTACSSSEKAQVHDLNPTQGTVALADSNFQDAAAQYKVLMARLPQDRLPKTYHEERDFLETSGTEWWTSGFYPGTLLYLYEETGDKALYDEAMRILKLLEKEQYNTSTHDLGFMMYDSFGNANRINPSPAYKQIRQLLPVRFSFPVLRR